MAKRYAPVNKYTADLLIGLGVTVGYFLVLKWIVSSGYRKKGDHAFHSIRKPNAKYDKSSFDPREVMNDMISLNVTPRIMQDLEERFEEELESDLRKLERLDLSLSDIM